MGIKKEVFISFVYFNLEVISNASKNDNGIRIAKPPIKKYKELLDMGAITQEEFDLKKTELL